MSRITGSKYAEFARDFGGFGTAEVASVPIGCGDLKPAILRLPPQLDEDGARDVPGRQRPAPTIRGLLEESSDNVGRDVAGRLARHSDSWCHGPSCSQDAPSVPTSYASAST